MPKKSDIDLAKSANRIKSVVVSREFFERIPKELRCYATTLTNIAKVNQSKMILMSLDGAIASGESFESWVQSIDTESISNIAKANLNTAYRTATQRVKNIGVYEKGLQDPEIEYFLYDATLDNRTRPNHAALDGTIRKKNDPFWLSNTPPIGFNCRCVLIALNKETAQGVSGKQNPVTTKREIDRKAKAISKETGKKVKAEPDDKFDSGLEFLKKSEKNLRKLIRNEIPKKFQKQFLDKLEIKEATADRYIQKNIEKLT